MTDVAVSTSPVGLNCSRRATPGSRPRARSSTLVTRMSTRSRSTPPLRSTHRPTATAPTTAASATRRPCPRTTPCRASRSVPRSRRSPSSRTSSTTTAAPCFTGDVTLTASGPAIISGTAPVASAIPAGQYALSESAVPGYSTNGFDCGATSTSLPVPTWCAPSSTMTSHPSLTLIKSVVNDDGGNARAFRLLAADRRHHRRPERRPAAGGWRRTRHQRVASAGIPADGRLVHQRPRPRQSRRSARPQSR